MREMKMKNAILIAGISLIFISGCSTAPLPQQEREVVFMDNVSASKKEGFDRALGYLSKVMNDSGHAIKLKDEGAGKIIVRMETQCNEVGSALDVTGNQFLTFNIELDFKDNKVRQTYEALSAQRRDVAGNTATREISSKGTMEDLKPCAERERANLLKAINENKNW